jgi:hypothetical protein
VETNSSGEIVAESVALGCCFANVWRIRIISGKVEVGRSGRWPLSNSAEAGVSPRLPTISATGPEPNGVIWA